MEEGDITLPDLVVFELFGEVAEGLGPAGQEDDPARLPVEAVDGMNPEPGITVDPVPEVRVSLDPGLKDGTEIPFPLLLDAQPGGLLHHEPALVRAEDRNGKRVCCHREKERQSGNLRICCFLFSQQYHLRVTQATNLTRVRPWDFFPNRTMKAPFLVRLEVPFIGLSGLEI